MFSTLFLFELIFLLFIGFRGSTIFFCLADTSGEWKLSVGDSLVYSISDSDETRSFEMHIWKKNTTDWGTERIWLNGSFLAEYIPEAVLRKGELPPAVDFTEEFCLDSVAGATISSLNSSFHAYFYGGGSPPIYNNFHPFNLIALYDPAFHIIPIDSPRLNWSSWLTSSFKSPTINYTGHIDDSVYYQHENFQTPALKITSLEERLETSNISSLTLKKIQEEICWYSVEWGILLEYSFLSESWLTIDNDTTYNSIETEYQLQDSSVDVYESEALLTPWMSPLMILALPVIYLIKKKAKG